MVKGMISYVFQDRLGSNRNLKPCRTLPIDTLLCEESMPFLWGIPPCFSLVFLSVWFKKSVFLRCILQSPKYDAGQVEKRFVS